MTDHQDKPGKESRNFIVRFFSTLGPGLITGAADDGRLRRVAERARLV